MSDNRFYDCKGTSYCAPTFLVGLCQELPLTPGFFCQVWDLTELKNLTSKIVDDILKVLKEGTLPEIKVNLNECNSCKFSLFCNDVL